MSLLFFACDSGAYFVHIARSQSNSSPNLTCYGWLPTYLPVCLC